MEDEQHPNRVPFHGLLTFVDRKSDKPPFGARGHSVILTRACAESALSGLAGMCLCFSPAFLRHDSCCKVGVITEAKLIGDEIYIDGHLFVRDFPEVVKAIKDNELALSYDLADARVQDFRAKVWIITKAHFTGAAILKTDKAAYRGTFIRLKNA
jgi:hypothetical protein